MPPANYTRLVEVFAVSLARKRGDPGIEVQTYHSQEAAVKDIKRRLRDHFRDDDLSPTVLHELATVVEAVVVETLRQRARKGGRARAKALSPGRRREIAKAANAARRRA